MKDFSAYKVTEGSIMHGGPSTINRARNIVSIDTVYGAAVHPSTGTSELIDSVSYSELADNQDCPAGSPCDHCLERSGLIMPLGGKGPEGLVHLDRQP